MVKPSSYFYEPLPLPPEKPKDDMKADTPSSVDQSPSAVLTGRGRGKGVRKPRKPKSKTPPVVNPQQQTQQIPQQIPNNQMNPMQMNIQNQISPNMQQAYQQNMVQNSNQIMAQQQIPNQAAVPQGINPGQQPNTSMGFVPGAPGMNQAPQQQQQWAGYNQIQQKQFYNQQGMQLNRFERPPINTSKQALSNMLRQRHPFMAGNQNNPAAFNIQQQQQQHQQQQQQQQQQQLQQRQQQQQQQFMRNTLRAVAPGQMGAAQGNLAAMNQGIGQLGQSSLGQGMNPNAIIAQQTQMQPAPNQMQTQQPNQSMISQAAGMMTNNAGGGLIAQQTAAGMVQTPMAQSGGMMQQQNVGMVNQGPQFQNFSGYGTQAMSQKNATQNMIGCFNQNPRNTQAEYIAQQRALQGNRGQYMTQAPNVTMNSMMGQGAAPPYPRQQATGGKPGVVSTQQQQQLQQQQQRMRQQMMMQASIGQQGGVPGMGQQQNQAMGQQQTPALVAQLQRQMPNQHGMMGQQYSHQPPPY